MVGTAERAVAAYLGGLRASGGGSAARVRQRDWALRELLTFAALRTLRDVGAGPMADPHERSAAALRVARVSVEELLSPEVVDDWVAFADPLLHGRATSSPATRRARVASLRALAVYLGVEPPAHRDPKPALRATLTAPEVARALRGLTGPLPGRGPHDHVRLAAVLAVMSAWPVRSAQLSALRVDQVVERGRGLLLDVPGEAGSTILAGVAAQRLQEWINVRRLLVSALEGGPVRALWTSIRSNSRPDGQGGSLPLPPGMPLRPRGLQRAYARSVEAANLVHAGGPGFPLPRSLDLLRRSLADGVGRAVAGALRETHP